MDANQDNLSVVYNLNATAQSGGRYKWFYVVCGAMSLVISWGLFASFLFSQEAAVNSFFTQAFATPIATLVSSDVLLSAFIFLAFAFVELKRLGMPLSRLLLYTLATLSVGVCFGLSVFLYQREAYLQREASLRRDAS